MEQEIFKWHSIVRIKTTGAFGEIKELSGDDKTGPQYEVWIYNEKGEIVTGRFDHEMLILECPPPFEYVEPKPGDIEILAEIIVNILLEDPKIIEQRIRDSKENRRTRKTKTTS